MGGKVEKLPGYQTKSSWRKTKRFVKHVTHRAMRRLGKKLGEDGPVAVRHLTTGWCD